VDWPGAIFEQLKAADVRQLAHVPDAGHARLLRLAEAEPKVRVVTLTTEEEGIALLAGAWLGGQRGVLLMQSSGVGNCINMLGLAKTCRLPLLMLVTMRGEWAEFNPWQVPMGRATPGVLAAMDTAVLRIERAEDAAETVAGAVRLAFEGGPAAVAVLIAQRLIGAKTFGK